MYIVIHSCVEDNLPVINKIYHCSDYESAIYHATELAIENGFNFVEVRAVLEGDAEYVENGQVIGVYKSG